MQSDARYLALIFCVFAAAGCSDVGSTPDARPDDDVASAGTCQRRVLVDEVTNARDLGGHTLSGGARLACGKLLRGGDLTGLSPGNGCAALAALGIRTVVDLRQTAVQQGSPPPACVSTQATVVSAPMPKLLPDTAANYVALMKEKQAVAAAFKVLGDPQAYPVYIHCVIGRDRASFITALALLALGASRQLVIDEFKLSTAAGVAVKPACIEAVLDAIDLGGGIEAYLSSCGVTAAQLATLRQQATSA